MRSARRTCFLGCDRPDATPGVSLWIAPKDAANGGAGGGPLLARVHPLTAVTGDPRRAPLRPPYLISLPAAIGARGGVPSAVCRGSSDHSEVLGGGGHRLPGCARYLPVFVRNLAPSS